MNLTSFLEWVKLPTKTLSAICVVAGILLFAYENLLDTLALQELVESFRAYIGVVFLVSLALVVVNSAVAILKFVKPWLVQAYWIRQGKKRLQILTPEEKDILRFYIDNQTRSQRLDIKGGTVNALQREKIIVRGSNLGSYWGFDFIIQPWAWEYLNGNPHLLE